MRIRNRHMMNNHHHDDVQQQNSLQTANDEIIDAETKSSHVPRELSLPADTNVTKGSNSLAPKPTTIDHIVKILIVGNAKCGKSSIIGRYISKTFESKYKSTVGADFARKDIVLELPNSTTIGVRLQLWDIAGQDRFQKLTRAYFAKAKGVVIVCDVSREGTVDAVKSWKREIDTWASTTGSTNIPVVLFANKADLLKDPLDAFKTGAIMERGNQICTFFPMKF